MKAVAGIDEAGLGPRLGPLCFGATLFTGPGAAVADLRAALAGTVARAGEPPGERLPIDDSKRLFAGRRSLASLELPALAALHPAVACPASLEAAVGGESDAAAWPEWYRTGPPLPRAIDAAAADRWRARLREALAARGIELRAAFVAPVLEEELNAAFARGLNKSDAVLARVGPLLRRLAEATAGIDLDVAVDRLGGRCYYGDFLRHLFPLRPLAVEEETPVRSSYRLREGGRTITVAFEVGGEGRHLPVALASCCAKYVRELFVERLNRCFAARAPGLAPTAGYPEDAQRWLADAAAVLAPHERARLVRAR